MPDPVRVSTAGVPVLAFTTSNPLFAPAEVGLN
jgi:hypothetical protein